MSEIHALSATQIAAAYAARQLSPVEVVRALLQRINSKDGELNAFVHVASESALEAARISEIEMASGNVRGPLHGIPVAIKDIIDIAGLPTTCHSKIRLNHIASNDATVIERLRTAGAIFLGKLALHEFATGGPAFDLPFPPARNPWNISLQPGGSSSGAGAALAAGLVPLAIGTDTGGSIRGPAALCGIVGLKPTYGLVSRRGVFPLAFSLDHVGPMARNVGDAALMLEAMAAKDINDPGSVAVPTRDYCANLQQGLAGLRIGFVRHFHETDLQANTEVVAALDDAAHDLAAAGAVVRTVNLPPLLEFTGPHRVLMQSEAWHVHSEWLCKRPADYSTTTRRKLMAGAFHSASDYLRAQQLRGLMIAAVNEVFRDSDVLLTANTMDTACRIDDTKALSDSYARQARSPFNLTGHPAISIMCGLSKAGLPLSLQFVARTFDETTLLRVAAAYERTHSWHSKLPLH